jgi:20S proteasome alpha/beta subunit
MTVAVAIRDPESKTSLLASDRRTTDGSLICPPCNKIQHSDFAAWTGAGDSADVLKALDILSQHDPITSDAKAKETSQALSEIDSDGMELLYVTPTDIWYFDSDGVYQKLISNCVAIGDGLESALAILYDHEYDMPPIARAIRALEIASRISNTCGDGYDLVTLPKNKTV